MKKILYVEDNPANRILVRQVLEMAGYTIIEAVNGLSGIKIAREEQPDLILMDINIPGMDGYETATRIKTLPELGNVPIIALTAKAMLGDRERALTAGCDGYISKPIDVDLLPQQVAEFLGGRREKVSDEQENVYLREYNERLVEHLEQKIEKLTQTNKTLSHADQMKSRFIDMAAHELRTPLAAMHGYLSILTVPGGKFLKDADEDTLEIINGVVASVDRLRGITQDMLDVTRIEAGTLQLKPTFVSLPLIFRKIQRDFVETIQQRHLNLTIADAEHLPAIWADGERVTQILRNLVGNAIKYTPDEGHININAEVMGSQSTNPQQFIKILVSDTGIGISSEQQEAIFQNFYEVREIEYHSTRQNRLYGRWYRPGITHCSWRGCGPRRVAGG